MFEWKVEDGKLMQEELTKFHNVYNCEKTVSREDKIAFCDLHTDNAVTIILTLVEKFEKDKETMPKDTWGRVKTVSLKAWLNKNDVNHYVDNDWHYGEIGFRIEGEYVKFRNIYDFSRKGAYDCHEDFVDEVFHRALCVCRKLEVKYFNEHDEYSILMKRVENVCSGRTFGLSIVTGTQGLRLANGDSDDYRRFTKEELEAILDMNDQLQEFYNLLVQQNPISFDNPIGELVDEHDIHLR